MKSTRTPLITEPGISDLDSDLAHPNAPYTLDARNEAEAFRRLVKRHYHGKHPIGHRGHPHGLGNTTWYWKHGWIRRGFGSKRNYHHEGRRDRTDNPQTVVKYLEVDLGGVK